MSQFIEMFGCKELITLNSVTKVLTGSTPARNNSDYWGGTHLWVSAQDMKSKYIDDTEEKITDLGLSKCKIIPKGSVLFVCRGSIGVIGIANKVCTCNQSICVSICNNSYLSDYVYYALKYNVEVIKNKYGEGTSFKSINQKTFAGLKIPKASNAEQESFVLIAEQADKSKFGGFKSQFIEMFGDPITNDKNWIIRPIKEVAPETTSNHGLTNNVWLLNLDMIESNTGLVIDKLDRSILLCNQFKPLTEITYYSQN